MKHLKEKYLDFTWVISMTNDMIEESLYHTETFAHSLRVHHNEKAAKVLELIAKQFKAEQSLVLSHIPNVDLPTIPPWEEPYLGYQHPANLLTEANYLMSESESWRVMQSIAKIHTDFYNFLRKESKDENVLRMVNQLLKHCQCCEEEHKSELIKCGSHERKVLEDLDIFALHSLEGGFW